jgi:hypothetical protein
LKDKKILSHEAQAKDIYEGKEEWNWLIARDLS